MHTDLRNGTGRAARGRVPVADTCYRELVERLPAVVYAGSFDPPGVSYVSPRVQDMLGHPPEAWYSDPRLWERLLHPEDRERVLEAARRACEAEQPFGAEYRLISKDGRTVWVRDEAAPAADGAGCRGRLWHGVMLDVTERREAEAALRESEGMFRAAFEKAGVGMAHLTPDGRWIRLNDELCRISGYPREELLGRSYLDLTPPEDRPASVERVERLLRGETGPYSIERRYVRKDGRRVWVNLSVSLVRGPGGEPAHLFCVAEDITARKLAELVPDPLTDRELQVLNLVARWRTNREIARSLAYSTSTIKLDVQSIIRKLGVKNRRQAAAKAVQIGLILPPS